ncbi:FAD binding domain [Popillia japonica]|uniref:Alkylglycerone-phosphate synthase n=1 Tax=Popillia japonica TaxID=7064 RepID=A0AAW1M0P6_POPJA
MLSAEVKGDEEKPVNSEEDQRKPVDTTNRQNTTGANNTDEICVRSAIPKIRQELLKWNGWGYRDSQFIVKDDLLYFTGDRYPIGGHSLPYFTQWVKDVLNVEVNKFQKMKTLPPPERYPNSNIPPKLFDRLNELNISYSTEGLDRLIRAHGHTLHDIYTLRESFFKRIPDIVIWPTSHNDVVNIVEFASEHNMVIIPFGGGTAVSGAIDCPDDPRTIISLDTSQMNKILVLDRENLTVTCESGIIGQDLERELQILGYTCGHEPDSYEFSSLGGWVATRASGMKKNIYGNIEDLLVNVKMVTPKGVLEKNCQVPRLSCGPDFNHVVMGSEGTFGVITEVTLKVRPVPTCRKYGSIVFPDFESGVKCMRAVARERCQPASIRLMDNEQFKFGQSLKPMAGFLGAFVDGLKKFYVTKIKRFDIDSMAVMTLLFEGEKKEVDQHEKRINAIADKFGGLPAGGSNGERGYMLTFVIAYIRDLALEYYVVAESFETSVPWDRAISLCKNVKYRISQECKQRGIQHYLSCCRVTQTYDAGCVIYFYFAFNYRLLKEDPVHVYESIEEKARDEIIACGGSISHHHGVGKLRRKWYPKTVSDVGVALFKATKRELDPQNIFATGNMVRSKL